MKEYTKSREIHPCKLERDDLLKLIKIVKEGFPDSERDIYFKLYSNLPNVSIESHSIEDFLEQEELPDKLNRLSIEIMGYDQDHRNINKNIHITFYDNYINLDINGEDQTWVLGKYAQIYDFLKKMRPWFWALNKIFPFFSGIMPVLSLFAIIFFIKYNQIVYSISTSFFLVSWILAMVYYDKGTFLPYTQIIIRSKKSILSKEYIIIIIAVLTFIVTVIGGIIIPLIK